VISTLADPAVDDELVDTEGEEVGEAVIVAATATLADTVRRVAGRFVEVEGDLFGVADRFVADLAGRLAK
jgi:hypothetical protein